jgi:hypothetical protein
MTTDELKKLVEALTAAKEAAEKLDANKFRDALATLRAVLGESE